MLDLTTIKREKKQRPPIITIYGRPKVGKTTFGADAPNSIILAIEKGQDGLTCSSTNIDSYQDMLDAITALHEQDHKFENVVVDSADWLERLIWDQVSKDEGVKSIEDLGYGKGYVKAINLWQQVLAGLESLRDNKGMGIIMIAHDQVKKYQDPTSESYDRYELKLHAKAGALVSEWSDCLLFATHKVMIRKEDGGFNKKVVKAKGAGRILYCTETPAYVAGNRFGLPDEIELSWPAFAAALKGEK